MVFGNLPMEPEELAARLVLGITKTVRADSSTPKWTEAVKQVLREIGQEKGFLISPNPAQRQGEYLLGMLWQKKAPCADLLSRSSPNGATQGKYWKILRS